MKTIYDLLISRQSGQFTVYNPKMGFSLIELLIIIGIIGILAGLLMANFVGVRQRARDGARKSDVRQIQSALELYRSDVGRYSLVTSSPFRLNTSACPTSSGLVSGAITYMQKIPCDPMGTGINYNVGSYYYRSNSSGSTYTLGACIENANDLDTNVTSTDPGGSGTCSSDRYYVLQNP